MLVDSGCVLLAGFGVIACEKELAGLGERSFFGNRNSAEKERSEQTNKPALDARHAPSDRQADNLRLSAVILSRRRQFRL